MLGSYIGQNKPQCCKGYDNIDISFEDTRSTLHSPIHLCASASVIFSSPPLLDCCFALSCSWLSKCWCCFVELLGLSASKGLFHSITKPSQIQQWVSQHFPNQLVYCMSDRLLANTSFWDHCHNRSSCWEWTNWHMTYALHCVTFRFAAQKWECFVAFLQSLPSKLKGSWGRFLIL